MRCRMWRSGRWTVWTLFDPRVIDGHVLSNNCSVLTQICLLPCKDQTRIEDHNSRSQNTHSPLPSVIISRIPNSTSGNNSMSLPTAATLNRFVVRNCFEAVGNEEIQISCSNSATGLRARDGGYLQPLSDGLSPIVLSRATAASYTALSSRSVPLGGKRRFRLYAERGAAWRWLRRLSLRAE